MPGPVHRKETNAATVRFAGDAGDGVHHAGDQLTRTSQAAGNAVFTFPDLPSEIRAPVGSLSGVSSFQVHFGRFAESPGDWVDTLVAMNPAALRVNLPDVKPDGIVIVNEDGFDPIECAKAGYERDPLTDGTLAGYRVIRTPINQLNRAAVKGLKLTPREADRSRSFFALGLVYWLYDRSLDPTLRWLDERFANQPDVFKAGKRSLKAGHQFGESLQLPCGPYRVTAKSYKPGVYRRVSGTHSLILGMAAAAAKAGREVFFAGFPVAPTAELLHQLVDRRPPGVCAAQAEDDAAAAGMALGAAFGGAIGVTATSGPGLSTMSEIIGLGVSAELPLVVIHAQRGGPAVGLPGKVEQSDLLQAFFGRNGECPVPILAVDSPANGFNCVIEAVRLATRYMSPVILLTDVFTLQASEAWHIPTVEGLPDLRVTAPVAPRPEKGKPFLPYARDVRLARPWALPGTPGLEHRIGGLEKEDGTGVVSYEPADHEHMVHVRHEKVTQIAGDIGSLGVEGPGQGDLLLVSWGGSCSAVRAAGRRLRERGLSVADAALRHLNPLPPNVANVLRSYKRVVVPELNCGQLRFLLRGQLMVDVEPMGRVQGRPMSASEIEDWVARDLARPRLSPEGWAP